MGLILNRRREMGRKSLPYDARIEYLESTGTQWVNTGYIPNYNTKVVIRYQYTTSNNWGGGFGICRDSATKRLHINTYQNKFHFGFGGSGSWVNTKDCDTNIHEATLTRQAAIIDGSSYNISGTDVDYTGYEFYLFLINDTTSQAIAKARLYKISFYNGDTLVHDFIPVRVGQVGYMYDKVSGQLFGNSGTGQFILGQDMEYKEIEYIQSSGTQYINTLYYPNNNTRVVCDMQIVDDCQYGRLFGCTSGSAWNSAPSFQINYEEYVSGGLGATCGNQTTWSRSSSVTGDYNRHNYELSNTSLYRDNVQVVSLGGDTFQCTGSLAIFSLNKGGTISSDGQEFSRAKLYSFKIYENGILARDFIPVRVGQVGYLYDKVSGTFFGNSGSGSFTLGPDV